MVDKYLRQIKKFDPLTREEEQLLFRAAKDKNDPQAKIKIIESNLRFVVQIARGYQNHGLCLEDLIAEGNIGLLKAYEKFEYSKNHKFITYAVWWIRQSITNALSEYSREIRLPLNKITNVSKVNKIKEEMEQDGLRHMSIEELSETMENPSILNDLKYNYTMVDLDKPHTDNDKNLNDIIADPDVNLFKNLEHVKDELTGMLDEFNEREQIILKMYYGIGFIRHYTLKEIGYELKLTRERIRQIKDKALKKLRKKRRADKLREYL